MKSAVASRLTLAELGSSPPTRLNWISKCIYQFLQTEKCVAFRLFFFLPVIGSRDPFWHPVQHLEQTDERENRGVWIRVDTSTCRQTRRTSEPAPRSGMDTSSLFGYRENPECEKTQLSGTAGSNLRYRQWNKYRGTNQRNSSVYPMWLL